MGMKSVEIKTIIESVTNEIVEKRSRFIANIYNIESVSEAEEKIKQIEDVQKIKRITINISYKEQYSTKTIRIKESDMSDFIENLIEDIKNRKATINDNEYVSEVARKNDKLRSIYVQVELKEDVSKTIRYISFEDINIEKYIY